jgi:probable F420-dependent oxidoreductase
MQFSLALPLDQVDPPELFCSAEAVMQIARAAEAAGFGACQVTDHPFPSRAGPDMGGHHSLDPLVCLAFAAAATTRLRLHTNALVAPYRNPFLAAKAIASLDVLARGRVILGMAPGYLEGEFAALGVPLAERAERFDEALAAMKRAWSGEPVELESPRFAARGNVMLPRPASRPHPPIWIGGNSRAAIRRAVAHAQGWMPFPVGPAEAKIVRTAPIAGIADLEARIGLLHAEAAARARSEPLDVCLTPFTHPQHPRGQERLDPPQLRDEIAALAPLGVTWLSIKLRSPDLPTLLANIERFGKEVIHAA